jgi:hypothetical protein
MVYHLPQPEDLVGSFRRFGETGPVYKVTGMVRGKEGSEMTIQIPETGEELERAYVHVLRDPEEG